MTTEPKPIPPMPSIMDLQRAGNLSYGEAKRIRDLFAPLASRLEAAQASIKNLKGAMMADDDRLTAAGNRVGLYFGCDTPDMMADEIEALKDSLSASQALAVELAEALRNAQVWIEIQPGIQMLRDMGNPDVLRLLNDMSTALSKFRSSQPQA